MTWKLTELEIVDFSDVALSVAQECLMALRRRFDKNAEFRAQYHSLGDMLDTVVWQRLHGVETTGTGEVLFICYGFRATDAKKLWQSIAWESFDLA